MDYTNFHLCSLQRIIQVSKNTLLCLWNIYDENIQMVILAILAILVVLMCMLKTYTYMCIKYKLLYYMYV